MYYHPTHLVPTVKIRPSCLRENASLRNGFDSLSSVQNLVRYPHSSYWLRPPNLGRDIPSISPEIDGVLAHNGFSDQIARPIPLPLHTLHPQNRFPNCLLLAELHQNPSDLLIHRNTVFPLLSYRLGGRQIL